jgi:signal transduction histidine kinase
MGRQSSSAISARAGRRVARAALPRARTARNGATRPAADDLLTDRFFRHLVFNLRTGVLAITRDGRIAAMNDLAYRVLGIGVRHDDIGRPFTEVLHDCPEICRVFHEAFDSDDLPNRAEMRLRKTGRAIGYTLSRIHDDAGMLVGATLFFKDLTRVEQLEERERLRDRLAALGEMAAAIAHEVKNPLAGIEVMAGILKRQLADSPDAQTTLADIIKEAKMANVIVQEVLAFVRPIRLQVEDIAITDVIRDAMAMAESHSARRDVDVRVDVPEALRPIQGDPHQLRQIFTNLLINAFEAQNGAGRVEITAKAIESDEETASAAEQATGPTIMVTVTDNGPGIAPEVMERIFSPFFTTKPQGSGLGLAIVRKIVDAHDGRIDVGARPGGGTVFRVTLPVRSQQQFVVS